MVIPKCRPVSVTEIKKLQAFVNRSKKLFVLTGAGISTESGIPDYRSEDVGLFAREEHFPLQLKNFVQNVEVRKRYWAGSYIYWPSYSSCIPNNSHQVLSDWEKIGKIHWMTTQNVDTLHSKAGNKKLTELYGSAYRVMCLECKHGITRTEMQELLQAYNPKWSAESETLIPDVSVYLTPEQTNGFKVPDCPKCGGVLKPKMKFLGDRVGKDVMDFLFGKIKECDHMLVIGTSLQETEAHKLLIAGKSFQKPIALLNTGRTRGYQLPNLTLDAKCGDVLPLLKIG